MKKFMLFIAVAALALGAQAYTYTLTMEIFNLPTSGGMHQGIYLADVKQQKVYAYLTVDEMLAWKDKNQAELQDNYLDQIRRPNGEVVNFLPDGAEIVGHQINHVSSYSGDNSYKFIVDFETAVKFDTYYDGESVRLENMMVVAPHDTADAAIDMNIGRSVSTTDDKTVYGLTAIYSYSSVPEPTSAMLLLLGFAGLALKRKVV